VDGGEDLVAVGADRLGEGELELRCPINGEEVQVPHLDLILTVQQIVA
jgi:hypothetical protein